MSVVLCSAVLHYNEGGRSTEFVVFHFILQSLVPSYYVPLNVLFPPFISCHPLTFQRTIMDGYLGNCFWDLEPRCHFLYQRNKDNPLSGIINGENFLWLNGIKKWNQHFKCLQFLKDNEIVIHLKDSLIVKLIWWYIWYSYLITQHHITSELLSSPLLLFYFILCCLIYSPLISSPLISSYLITTPPNLIWSSLISFSLIL